MNLLRLLLVLVTINAIVMSAERHVELTLANGTVLSGNYDDALSMLRQDNGTIFIPREKIAKITGVESPATSPPTSPATKSEDKTTALPAEVDSKTVGTAPREIQGVWYIEAYRIGSKEPVEMDGTMVYGRCKAITITTEFKGEPENLAISDVTIKGESYLITFDNRENEHWLLQHIKDNKYTLLSKNTDSELTLFMVIRIKN